MAPYLVGLEHVETYLNGQDYTNSRLRRGIDLGPGECGEGPQNREGKAWEQPMNTKQICRSKATLAGYHGALESASKKGTTLAASRLFNPGDLSFRSGCRYEWSDGALKEGKRRLGTVVASPSLRSSDQGFLSDPRRPTGSPASFHVG
jgi:hypothetical protein